MSEVKPLNKRERLAQKRVAQANGEQPPIESIKPSSTKPIKQSNPSAAELTRALDKAAKKQSKQSAKSKKQAADQEDKPSFMLNQSKNQSKKQPASEPNQGWRRIELNTQMFDSVNQSTHQAGFLCLEEISGAEFASNLTRYNPSQKYGDDMKAQSIDASDDQSVNSKKRKLIKQSIEQKKKARMAYIPSLDYDPSEEQSVDQAVDEYEHSSDDEDQIDQTGRQSYEQSNAVSDDESTEQPEEVDEEVEDESEEPTIEAEVTNEAQALLSQLMAEAGDDDDDFDDEDQSGDEEMDQSVDQSEDELVDESIDQSVDEDVDDVEDAVDQQDDEEEEDDEAVEQSANQSAKPTDAAINQLMSTPVRSSQWDAYGLHPLILHALVDKMGFNAPTDIQSKCLAPSITQWRDVIAASATGSGKTLAFGLPIVHRLLSEGKGLHKYQALEQSTHNSRGVSALILTPTRELALQIVNHLEAISQFTHLKIISIVGGMSAQKQARLIDRSPDIIVATPGRLYQLMTELTATNKSNGATFAQSFNQLRFLVLDEADRMTAAGHFSELESILELIYKQRDQLDKQSATDSATEQSTAVSKASSKQKPLQHFLFSATLALDFAGRENMKTAHLKKKKSHQQKQQSVGQMIEKLRGLLRIAKSPFYVDLTGDKLVSTLNEEYINCLVEEKDFFFYALVLQLLYNSSTNPSTTTPNDNKMIVFVNAISCLRRLTSLSQLLGLPVYPLHAEMQQKQRLKSLDRFVRSSPSVLLTTDVSSRGLDIPQVNTVVHYQLPINSEIYIHRCGRTARAGRSGQAIALISENDSKIWSRIRATCHGHPSMQVGIHESIERFDVDERCMFAARARMTIARKIDLLVNQTSKQTHKRDWLKKHAAEMDMMIDSDDEPCMKEHEDDDENRSANAAQIRALQQDLQRELKKPIATSKRHANFFTLNIAQHLQQQEAEELKITNQAESEHKSSHKSSSHTHKATKPTNQSAAKPINPPAAKPTTQSAAKPAKPSAVKPLKPATKLSLKPSIILTAEESAIVADAKAAPIKLKRTSMK